MKNPIHNFKIQEFQFYMSLSAFLTDCQKTALIIPSRSTIQAYKCQNKKASYIAKSLHVVWVHLITCQKTLRFEDLVQVHAQYDDTCRGLSR